MVYNGNNDNPFAGSTVIDGWGTTDTLTNITRIKGSAYDDDITITVSNSDALRWYVWGMDGADTITGSDGTLVRVMYLEDPAGVTVDLMDTSTGGTGTAKDGWGNTDTLIDIHTVSGSNYSDSLTGSNENDGFFGTLGNDTIDGLGGWDWISYSWIDPNVGFNGLDIDLSSAEDQAIGYDSFGEVLFIDQLSNIELVEGSIYNDTLRGNDANNWLWGYEGDDTLYGGSGGDTLDGGQGNDYLDGGEFQGRSPRTTASYRDDPAGIAASLVYNGNNDNPFAGSTVTDGWGTTDTLTNITRITGSAYDDNITINIVNSDDLRWYVWGMDGADTITGNDGHRVRAMYLDDPGDVAVNLGTGSATDGWGNTDTLIGIQAASGSHFGNDTLTGASAHSGFHGTRGNDTISGVAGYYNWISYGWMNYGNHNDGFDGVEIDLSLNYAKGYSGETLLFTDTLENINHAWGSPLNDILIGNDYDNELGGEEGDDIIIGGNGWDILYGGQGNDTLVGGEFEGRWPRTTASYQNDPERGEGQGITATMLYDGSNAGDLFEGSTITDGWGDIDTLTNITRIKGSAHDDDITITVSNSDNLRWFIWGMDGADTITGSDGTRVRVMYMDDPEYTGAPFEGDPDVNGVVVTLAGDGADGRARDGWGNEDTLRNIHTVSGSNYNDSLTGSDEGNGFLGTLGNDTIDGLGGWDWIGYGLDGSGGFNRLAVDLSMNYAKGYSGETLLFTDDLFNLEEVWGSPFDDILIGDDFDNILAGDAGFDTLTGNGGNDQFYFTWFNRFGPEWWDSDYNTVTDFTVEIEGENDVIVFGETWGPGFYADGVNTYTSASSEVKADPKQYQIIGVIDTVAGDWSDIETVLSNAVELAASGDGTDDDTYFLAQDGAHTRILVWEGDVNGNSWVDNDELTWLAQLDEFTDIASLGEAHFQIV
jgi:Ca2+-binding RTX toxin-like protein